MEEQIKMSDYSVWIKELKAKIHEAKRKVAYSINSQLIELYWDLGRSITEKQIKANWGSNLIEKTSIELTHEFPEIKGFSRRNLYAMCQLYKFYSTKYQFVPQFVAQLPWGHNRIIISKIKDIFKTELENKIDNRR